MRDIWWCAVEWGVREHMSRVKVMGVVVCACACARTCAHGNGGMLPDVRLTILVAFALCVYIFSWLFAANRTDTGELSRCNQFYRRCTTNQSTERACNQFAHKDDAVCAQISRCK
jgi:hypothetical protein